jgi:hypothetical protein
MAKDHISIVPYSLELAPADFFLFPKLKTALKEHCFQNHRGDSVKCDKITVHHNSKSVPGSIPTMKETMGMVYHQ